MEAHASEDVKQRKIEVDAIAFASIVEGRRRATWLPWDGDADDVAVGDLLRFCEFDVGPAPRYDVTLTGRDAVARVTHVIVSETALVSFVLDDDRYGPTEEQMRRARIAASEWNTCDPPTSIPPDAVRAIVKAVVGV